MPKCLPQKCDSLVTERSGPGCDSQLTDDADFSVNLLKMLAIKLQAHPSRPFPVLTNVLKHSPPSPPAGPSVTPPFPVLTKVLKHSPSSQPPSPLPNIPFPVPNQRAETQDVLSASRRRRHPSSPSPNRGV